MSEVPLYRITLSGYNGTPRDVIKVHPAPCTLNPAPCTLNPAPCTLHPKPCTLNPKP